MNWLGIVGAVLFVGLFVTAFFGSTTEDTSSAKNPGCGALIALAVFGACLYGFGRIMGWW